MMKITGLYGGFYGDTELTTMYRALALTVAFRMTEEEDRDGNGAGRLAVTGGECCPRQHYREWFCGGISERVVLYATEGCYTTRTMIRRTRWWKQ
ncbi:hypothetical protein K0M31_012756 [Melipona bicolor]|uniref:Uncharacterized protein n=1 Tax=Melipona bicolor TaxID=60889 RepID=A0AA40FJ31_9HYME|nr:hypothetical protein K0M31_012756 [Melipona bicolor]